MPRPSPRPESPSQAQVVDRMEAVVVSLMERMVRAPQLAGPAERGLSYPQYRILAHLCVHDRIKVGEVGLLLGIARSSATEMVARMERDGLVSKSRPHPNSREVHLEPTEQARLLVRQRRGMHRQVFKQVLGRLPPEDGHELLRALETVGRLLDKAMP